MKGSANESESESHSAVSDSLQPHGLYRPWNSPGQNTGVGSLFLLQGIFPTQGSNPGLPIAGRFFTSWATREAHKYLVIIIDINRMQTILESTFHQKNTYIYIRSDQSLSCVLLFATPWIAARQASLYIYIYMCVCVCVCVCVWLPRWHSYK